MMRNMPKKKPIKHKEAHTDNVIHGMGDFYGTSKRQPLGRSRSTALGNPTTKKQRKTLPKTLA